MAIRITKVNKKREINEIKIDISPREAFTEFLKDSIDFQEYEGSRNSFSEIKNPFLRGLKILISEKKYEFDRKPFIDIFIDYLKGLPTWLDIPFTYWDIRNLLYSLGYDEVKDEDWDDMKIDKLYYDEIYSIFMEESRA